MSLARASDAALKVLPFIEHVQDAVELHLGRISQIVGPAAAAIGVGGAAEGGKEALGRVDGPRGRVRGRTLTAAAGGGAPATTVAAAKSGGDRPRGRLCTSRMGTGTTGTSTVGVRG